MKLAVMWKKLIIIILFTATICSAAAKSNRKNDRKDSSIPVYEVTSFDYDDSYGKAAHKSIKSKASPSEPTERPFIKYWNNFIRSVRLPIPTITWNMTNPLATIFNEGASNLIETPVVDYDNYDDTKRRRKNSTTKKRKTSNKRSKSRRRQKVEITDMPSTAAAAETAANDAEQQIVLQPYPIGVHPAHAMYFYDANADQYYEVQRERNSGNNGDITATTNNNNKYQNGNYYDTTGSYYDKLQKEDDIQEQEDTIEEGEGSAQPENETVTDNKPEVGDNGDDGDKFVSVQLENGGSDKRLKKESDKPIIDKINEETLRNVIGSYMKDDRFSRHRQQTANSKTSTKTNLKERPRIRYYFLDW